MSSAICFLKLDNDRTRVATKMVSNQNRIDELHMKSTLLWDTNRELRGRQVEPKEYDNVVMRLCGWLFNKSNSAHRWANKLRQKMISYRVDKLCVKREGFQHEDEQCFAQECRALRQSVKRGL